jgi:hypothetical protein
MIFLDGRAWKPQVSRACTFGRFPSRPGTETPSFLQLHLGGFRCLVDHGNPPSFPPSHLGGGMEAESFPQWHVFWTDGWKPQSPHTLQSGLLPSPDRAWKPQVSHTRTWAASIARPDPDSLHLGGFALDRLGNPEFPHTLGRRIRPWSARKPQVSRPHTRAWKLQVSHAGTLGGRMETPSSPRFAIRATSVARPGVETPSFPHSHMGSVRRPAGRGNPRFPALGQFLSRPAWKPRISPHAWAVNPLSVGLENSNFPTRLGGEFALGRPGKPQVFQRLHLGPVSILDRSGEPEFWRFLRWLRLGNPEIPTLGRFLRSREPRNPHTWAVSPLVETREPRIPHTWVVSLLVETQKPRIPRTWAVSPLVVTQKPRIPRTWAVSPLVETRKPRIPRTWAVSPLVWTRKPRIPGTWAVSPLVETRKP